MPSLRNNNLPDGFENFWHRRVPVDSICIYRIGFGLLVCTEAVSWLPYTTELFSNRGFHLGPLAEGAPDPWSAAVLCLLLIFFSLCLSIGLCTKSAILGIWGIWSFFYGIDLINEKAISTIVMIVLAVLFFSDCQARYSMDDWIGKMRGLPRVEDATCIFAQRLLQIEFFQVYFFSGLVKLMSPQWREGSVLKHILAGRWATDIGVAIEGILPDKILRFLAQLTIAYEMAGSSLLFVRKIRPCIIGLGILFHLGTIATLYIGFLGVHFIWALMIIFPDPETIASFRKRKAWFLKGALRQSAQ